MADWEVVHVDPMRAVYTLRRKGWRGRLTRRRVLTAEAAIALLHVPWSTTLPVLPDGVEGVLIFARPARLVSEEEPSLCFVCEQPMPDPESGEMCWGVPGRGVAHGDCYGPIGSRA